MQALESAYGTTLMCLSELEAARTAESIAQHFGESLEGSHRSMSKVLALVSCNMSQGFISPWLVK
jgi:hypothetical protein